MLLLLLAHTSRYEPCKSLSGSSQTTPRVDFHHRRTACPSYNKIKRLADYAVRQCCDNSENCYWSVSYDELYHHFGAEVTDTNENGKLVEKELRQREEINELIMTEDAIEMTCHLRYCPQCKDDPVSLLSVLGCNIYDEHESEHHHEPANESSDEDETQALSM